mmetsp:Transcript_6827/g.10367  ORF Transcript_6827/g.10367 Transcript_6827/m.10367 type:complete len:412 (-) Transcript_6827:29-1264(-)
MEQITSTPLSTSTTTTTTTSMDNQMHRFLASTSTSNEASSSQTPTDSGHCGSKILTPHYLFHKKIADYTNSTKDDYEIVDKRVKVFVNKHEKTFGRKHLYQSCSFVSATTITHIKTVTEAETKSKAEAEAAKGPTPVVFIVSGRSGSSNTWMTLSKLAGERNEALETVGSSVFQVKKFFHYLKTEEMGAWWVKEHLCEITKYRCQSAIAGFQWKPYGNSISSPAGKGILKEIASFSFNGGGNSDSDSGSQVQTQVIRVLFMTRNPIDVLMSGIKHHFNNISAHCASDDKECLQRHKSAQKQILLPTEGLLDKLKSMVNDTEVVKNTLSDIGVDYYYTTYEKLYNNDDDAEEWMRIFRYLGRGPTQGLTFDDVEKAFPYAKTSKSSRKDMLLNYKEIKSLLQGTEFSHFLDD